MTERDERSIFDGTNRRIAERRRADRRKFSRMVTVLKYICVAVLAAILVKIFTR